ncbi:hypothetical protein KI387_026947, partial [Taxus chinensis]
LCSDDESDIPFDSFQFTKIAPIKDAVINTNVDVIGVVKVVSETYSIHQPDGTKAKKYAISICDTSDHSIDITLWGVFCETEGTLLHDLHHGNTDKRLVVALKWVKVTSFNGKVWATAFEDVGSSIMVLSAQALYDIAQQPDHLPTVLEQVKKELYNDNKKLG